MYFRLCLWTNGLATRYLVKMQNESYKVCTESLRRQAGLTEKCQNVQPLNYCHLYLGGLIVVPQKHKGSVTSHYNSGFFITTNNYPDFGGGRDGEAIKRRLCVFETKALRKKDANVSGEFIII